MNVLNDQIILVAITDDKYSMPLAVMVKSILTNLNANLRILLYIIDCGISNKNKLKITDSWNHDQIKVKWIKFEMKQFANIKVKNHIS